jgi:hypothetical protein
MTFNYLTVGLGAAGIVAGSFVMNAPDVFPYLWVLKAVAMSFAGIAIYLMNPMSHQS